ncbi:hypothetical protein [Streptomyces sp. NPDC015130]
MMSWRPQNVHCTFAPYQQPRLLSNGNHGFIFSVSPRRASRWK